jgi:TetR/AcrR family transcriptional regulator, fatty acid metabolism regulator protein
MVDKKKQDKRTRIIDSAIVIFAEKGYHLGNMNDIAAKAEVAVGSIYRYFNNKEDLLIAIFEEKMGELIHELEQRLQKIDDPKEKLFAFIHQHFFQIEAKPQLAHVFQVELRQSHRFFREYRPQKLWEYLQILQNIILLGQEQGIFRRNLQVKIIQWTLFGALDEMSIHWVLSREKTSLVDVTQEVFDIFMGGLRQ